MATTPPPPKTRTDADEKTEITAEGALAPQFGSDPKLIAKGKFDPRIHSNIPNEILALIPAVAKLIPDSEGGTLLQEVFDDWYQRCRSVNGFTTNKMIQETAASKGVPAVTHLKQKPGWLARHTTQKDWRERAEQEGATTIE